MDDRGGVWTALSARVLGRIPPEALGTGGDTTPVPMLEDPDGGYVGGLAFFPAAADLPLYHSF